MKGGAEGVQVNGDYSAGGTVHVLFGEGCKVVKELGCVGCWAGEGGKVG